MIRCFVTIVGPYKLLPYFLRYYSRVGVDHFIFNAFEADPARYERIEEVFKGCDVSYERGFWEQEEIHNGRNRTKRVKAMLRGSHRWLRNDWVLYPDLDEFAEFPNDSIREYVSSLPAKVKIVQGEWWDRVAADGSMPEIVAGQPLEEQFPVALKLSHLFMDVTHVIVACKNIVPLGHHPKIGKHAKASAFSSLIPVHHFRWNGAIRERLVDRHQHYAAVGMPTAVRLKILVDYLANHEVLPIHGEDVEFRESERKLGI